MGRAEILEELPPEEPYRVVRARLPRAFRTMVRGYLEVVRISPDVEAGAPGAYGGAGTIDGREPGHFWINLRTPDLHRKFDLPDLTYHEAIPGHVWQGEYTFHQPLIRSLLAFNAYSEGWALYAQQLADEEALVTVQATEDAATDQGGLPGSAMRTPTRLPGTPPRSLSGAAVCRRDQRIRTDFLRVKFAWLVERQVAVTVTFLCRQALFTRTVVLLETCFFPAFHETVQV